MAAKKPFVLVVLCVLAAAVVLSAGCISTGDSGTDLSNTLVYAGEGQTTINPILNGYQDLTDLVFTGLMKFDAKANPVCDLAESYTYDPASKTYTFNLRKDVTWHDGEKFTAEDVVFTYNVLIHDDTISSEITSNYEDIESVTALNDYTVVFKMKQPNAAMLSYFTRGIAPEHLLKGQDINTASFNQNPVGTGKYKFVEWDKANSMVILERNTDFYGKVPNIECIVYKHIQSVNARSVALSTGEADLAWVNANYAETFRGNSNYKNIDFKSADYRAVSMNFGSDFWKKNADSVAVLSYAVDKQRVVDSVFFEYGFAAYSPIQLSEYGGNKAADKYSYNVEKFHKEMEKLGWKKGSDGIYERNGQDFHFICHVNADEEERVDVAQIVSDMLEKQGVIMELRVEANWDIAKYDAFLAGYAAEFDPDMMYANFVTGASGNSMQYSNADVDKLLADGRHEENTEKRKAIYHEFEEVYADAPGLFIICYIDANYVSIPGLNGLDTDRVLGHHAAGVMWNVEEWTLSK